MDIDGDGSTSDDAYNDSKGHFKKVATIAKGLGLPGEETGRASWTSRTCIYQIGVVVPVF